VVRPRRPLLLQGEARRSALWLRGTRYSQRDVQQGLGTRTLP
jgi:hypothetical protein